MDVELKGAIDSLGSAWEQFKKADAETKGRSESERKEILEKVTAAIDTAEAAKKAADTLLADANRRAMSGNSNERPEVTEHKQAYAKWMRKGVGEDQLGDLERKAMTIGTAADGGYALPEQIERTIQDKLIDISPIRAIATVVQVSTNDYKRLVNVRGTASGWVAETAARTATNTSQLYEAAAYMGDVYVNSTVSQWSLDDLFFDVEAFVASEVATEMGRVEGNAFVVGDGSSKPKGFMGYTTAATADSSRAAGTLEHVATGVAGDFAATNKGDTLVTTVYKLKAGHRNGAVWVTNKAILGEIRAFKESTTNAYLWQPGLAAGQPSTLLGYPVVEAEDVAAKAASSLSIAFGNFRNGYCVVDRVGIRMLRDPYTNKPNVQFYANKRVGGMVLDSEAIKIVKFAVS